MYEWDDEKQAAALAKHGVDFALMAQFQWETSLTREDRRNEYFERRFVSLGLIGNRLFCCAWTPRQNRIRIVSLRKCNARERVTYEKAKNLH